LILALNERCAIDLNTCELKTSEILIGRGIRVRSA